MKLIAAMSLFLTLSSAHAVDEFGGIKLDWSIPGEQIGLLKSDIRYLFETPVTEVDQEFLKTTGLKKADGEHMHNWILNRVRYIVGEDMEGSRLVKRPKLLFRFPDTPLPDEVLDLSSLEQINQVQTVMTNIGGAFYLGGKMSNMLVGLKFPDETVTIKSPRSGILQVGSGLFSEDLMINRDQASAANSVSRIGTLFHEARHSDGNGKSTGFVHSKCPPGHDYEGHAACEISGNGSYTVGALSQRHLLKNCTRCSTEDKIILSAVVVDAFDRIFAPEKLQLRAGLDKEISDLKFLVELFSTTEWPDDQLGIIEAEIKAMENKIAELERQRAEISISPDETPAFLDATPEGSYSEINVKKSSSMMKKSLSK